MALVQDKQPEVKNQNTADLVSPIPIATTTTKENEESPLITTKEKEKESLVITTTNLVSKLPSDKEIEKNYRFLINNQREQVIDTLKELPNFSGLALEKQLLECVAKLYPTYKATTHSSDLWKNLEHSTREIQCVFLVELVFWHAWHEAVASAEYRYHDLTYYLKSMVYTDIKSRESSELIYNIIAQIDAHNQQHWDAKSQQVVPKDAALLVKFYDEVLTFCKLLVLVKWQLDWTKITMQPTYDVQALGHEMSWMVAYPTLVSADGKHKVPGCVYQRSSALFSSRYPFLFA
jgi:hypothetical protein